MGTKGNEMRDCEDDGKEHSQPKGQGGGGEKKKFAIKPCSEDKVKMSVTQIGQKDNKNLKKNKKKTMAAGKHAMIKEK